MFNFYIITTMKKNLFLLLSLVVIVSMMCACGPSKAEKAAAAEREEYEAILRMDAEIGQSYENRQKEMQENKPAYFEREHERLNELPPRSFEDGYLEKSNYPDEYYEEVKKLYKEEIAYNIENYGEEAKQKVLFLLKQIPVTGRYTVGTVIAPSNGNGGLRDDWNHKYASEAFDAVRAQIAHDAINDICDYALNLALGMGYMDIAKSILICYKPTIEITNIGEHDHSKDKYKVSTSYTSRDAAKEQIALLN